jgi:hypothetical protein
VRAGIRMLDKDPTGTLALGSGMPLTSEAKSAPPLQLHYLRVKRSKLGLAGEEELGAR